MAFNPNSSTIWADGPSSQPDEPSKYQIRQWGVALEAAVGLF